MQKRIRGHIRSNVVGYVALFFALSGGAAWATHPGGANTISSGDIIDNEVKTQDVRDGNMTRDDIRTGAVVTEHIATGAVQSIDLANGAVTEPKLGCEGNDPADVMVKVGSVCVDRYEASIWDAPTGGNQIDATTPTDYCNPNGQDCTDIYARSVAGVEPARQITWFQAQQALANSGKRLPTNAEWQMAVAGTPDSTDCNVSTGSVANTGANANCISNHGANDMVGNMWEWVGDWDEKASDCDDWPAGYGTDRTCVGGAPGTGSDIDNIPGALIRGGNFNFGTSAGPFIVNATGPPSDASNDIGFRGAR